MVRIQIKGGIWKNSEDEVLKAAVMKYGLNNWSRVSSLLVRKTAKQCKARWYEWLDPSVKKTEWTKDEDEKLLHLAKCFPCQWRTIAPVVGRTANQCLERYERLLDIAQNREVGEDDPRKLRPGEVDPHPHTKPARADAQDMDEDEKEMLTEARARLANTRGKKAKRKAREAQLAEARRLAQLQKSRELKAAGVLKDKEVGRRKRKRMDYATEIPFLQEIPKGFHETGPEENPISNIGTSKVALTKIEQERRDREEQHKRKEDERQLKRLKKDNLAEHMEIVNKMNDPASTRKRSELSLPTPVLEDWELQQLAKMGEQNAKLQGAAGGLIQSYDTPLPSDFAGRTPGTPAFVDQDVILKEAQNAVRRNEMQTPLMGEENPELHPTDFTGVLPPRMRGQAGGSSSSSGMNTPSGMTPGGMTPSGMTPGGMTPGGMTPGNMTPSGMSMAGGRTPGGMTSQSMGGRTPMSSMMTPRDGLGLASEMDPLEAKDLLKSQVRNAFAALPKAGSTMEITMPANLEETIQQDQEEEEAEDADARAERLQREAEEAERERRKLASLVVQRNYAVEENGGYAALFSGVTTGNVVTKGDFGSTTAATGGRAGATHLIKMVLPVPCRPEQLRLLDSQRAPLFPITDFDDESVRVPEETDKELNFALHRHKAERAILREMQSQILRDAHDYGSVPLTGDEERPEDLVPDITAEELLMKRRELDVERELLRQEHLTYAEQEDPSSSGAGAPGYPEQSLAPFFEENLLPDVAASGEAEWSEKEFLSGAETLAGMQLLFERLRDKMKADSARAAKLEKRVGKNWGEEFAHFGQAMKKVPVLAEQRLEARRHCGVYAKLGKDEEKLLTRRKADLQSLVDQEKNRNRDLQHEFEALEKIKRDLTLMLA
ncbi:unnamed protein product [Amoebophrya sp. A25]|nr:unnamed protein product [Amoebophrya sp. A25]|eukprot:GSA25T00003897001.1